MRILHVEDNIAFACTVAMLLSARGYVVETARSGEEALSLVTLYPYDAVVLDTTLPDMRGASLIRAIRRAKVPTSIIVLSAISDVAEKVDALNFGADDYMTKPFLGDELVAHINAVVRRREGHATSVLQVGKVHLNLDTKRLTVGGQAIHLTKREYQLIEVMALKRGRTLSKESLLLALYGGRDEPELKIIDVFVCKLRAKLRALGAADHIETVWGQGYALREPLPVVESPPLVPFESPSIAPSALNQAVA